jgi:excisionase family DNA binding protein
MMDVVGSMSHVEQSSPHVARVLTVPEVADLLRCSKAHVHNLINGKVHGTQPLPSIALGRRRLVRRESLNSWIERNERGAA